MTATLHSSASSAPALPAFSLLMSVYEGESAQRFDEALSSVVEQTVPAAEFVIVEDGPLSDDIAAVRDRWRKRLGEKYVQVALPTNVGLARALNAGLQRCRCQWVARMDSDDKAPPKRFENQINHLQSHPDLHLLGGQVGEYDENLNERRGERRVPLDHDDIVRYAAMRNPFNHMTVMFRRDSALAVGGYPDDLRRIQDYGLWIRMLASGCRTANIDVELAAVRAGDELLTRRRGTAYFRYEWRLFRMARKIGFISRSQFVRAVASRLIVRYLPRPVTGLIYNRVLKRGV